jgi:hypothetical protein
MAALAASAGAAQIGAFTTKNAYSYVATPKLHPPKITGTMNGKASQLAGGYFFVTNFPDLSAGKKLAGQSGPLILDRNLQPVWFNPVPTNVLAANLELQHYNGKPALSWWQGTLTKTGQILSGEDVVVDNTYKTVATLKAAAPWTVALHEMIISGTNAWVVVTRNVDGAAHGGPAGSTLVDTAVAEYDLKTGQQIYLWDPLDHVSVKDTFQGPLKDGVWDPYHVNSVQLTGHGTFLVSLRNTSAAYMVDKATSQIVWTLGGRHSSFKFGKNAAFAFQHDVQLHRNGVVSMFDDHCCAQKSTGKFSIPSSATTRGLVLKLDLTKKTATYVTQYIRSKGFLAAFLGSMQLLGNGGALVGWGSQPYFSEYDKSGKLLLDATFPAPDQSYRAQLERWKGFPAAKPDGGVKTSGSKATVYASWNGSTQVKQWVVLAGSSTKHLSKVASAKPSGFETAIALNTSYRQYEVQALDGRGHVLGTSNSFPRGGVQYGKY